MLVRDKSVKQIRSLDNKSFSSRILTAEVDDKDEVSCLLCFVENSENYLASVSGCVVSVWNLTTMSKISCYEAKGKVDAICYTSSAKEGNYLIFGGDIMDDAASAPVQGRSSLPTQMINRNKSLMPHHFNDSAGKSLTSKKTARALSENNYSLLFWQWNDNSINVSSVAKAHSQPIISLCSVKATTVFTNDCSVVISGGNDNTVRFWNVSTRAALKIIHLDAERKNSIRLKTEVNALCFHLADNSSTVPVPRLFMGQETGEIVCFEFADLLEDGSQRFTKKLKLLGHTDGVNDFAVFTQKNVGVDGLDSSDLFLLSCSEDKTIRMWDMGRDYLMLRTFIGHTAEVHRVIVTHTWERGNEPVIVSTGWDSTIRMWNPRLGTIITDIHSSSMLASITAYDDHHGKPYLVFGDSAGVSVRASRISVSSLLYSKQRVLGSVSPCALCTAPNLSSVVIGDTDNQVYIFVANPENTNTLKKVTQFSAQVVGFDTMDTLDINTNSDFDTFKLHYFFLEESQLAIDGVEVVHALVCANKSSFRLYDINYGGNYSFIEVRPEITTTTRRNKAVTSSIIDVIVCCSGPVFSINPIIVCALTTHIVVYFLGSQQLITVKDADFAHYFSVYGDIRCICAHFDNEENLFNVTVGYEYGAIIDYIFGSVHGKDQSTSLVTQLEGSPESPPHMTCVHTEVLKGHQERVNCLKNFTLESGGSEKNYLVSGSLDSTVRIWDICVTFKEVTVLRSIETEITSVNVHYIKSSPDVVEIVSAGADGIVCVWKFDGLKGYMKKRLIGHNSGAFIFDLSFLPCPWLSDSPKLANDADDNSNEEWEDQGNLLSIDAESNLMIWDLNLEGIASSADLQAAFDYDICNSFLRGIDQNDEGYDEEMFEEEDDENIVTVETSSDASATSSPLHEMTNTAKHKSLQGRLSTTNRKSLRTTNIVGREVSVINLDNFDVVSQSNKVSFSSFRLLIPTEERASLILGWHGAQFFVQAALSAVNGWSFVDSFLELCPHVLLLDELRFIDAGKKDRYGNTMKVSLLYLALSHGKLKSVRVIIKCWLSLLNHAPEYAYEQIYLHSLYLKTSDILYLAHICPVEFESFIMELRVLKAHPIVLGKRELYPMNDMKDSLVGVENMWDSSFLWPKYFTRFGYKALSMDMVKGANTVADAFDIKEGKDMRISFAKNSQQQAEQQPASFWNIDWLTRDFGNSYREIVYRVRKYVCCVHSDNADSSLQFTNKLVSAYFVPLVHCSDLLFIRAFIKASDKLQRKSIFNAPVVAFSLRYAWKQYGLRLHMSQLYKFLLYCISFVFAVVFYGDPEKVNTSSDRFGYFCQFPLLALNSYFFIEEIRQLQYYKRRIVRHFLDSIWNGIDVWNYATIFGGTIYRIITRNDTYVSKSLFALAAVSMCLKMLYYFRAFQSTGKLIAYLVRIVISIRYFLCVLCIVVFGFALAFWIMCNRVEDNDFATYDGSLVQTFAFMMGSYDNSQLNFNLDYTSVTTSLSVLFMVISAVILLNLLIAIMNDIYASVDKQANAQFRWELSTIISDNMYAYSNDKKKADLAEPLVIHCLRIKDPLGDDDFINIDSGGKSVSSNTGQLALDKATQKAYMELQNDFKQLEFKFNTLVDAISMNQMKNDMMMQDIFREVKSRSTGKQRAGYGRSGESAKRHSTISFASGDGKPSTSTPVSLSVDDYDQDSDVKEVVQSQSRRTLGRAPSDLSAHRRPRPTSIRNIGSTIDIENMDAIRGPHLTSDGLVVADPSRMRNSVNINDIAVRHERVGSPMEVDAKRLSEVPVWLQEKLNIKPIVRVGAREGDESDNMSSNYHDRPESSIFVPDLVPRQSSVEL